MKIKCLIATIIVLVSCRLYSQSTWDNVGMSRTEIIESLGSGISGENNSLIYIGPSGQYIVSSGWTFYFNNHDIVKKVIFTTLHRTKALAIQQSYSIKNVLKNNGFSYLSENKFSNGNRTVTLSFKSENGLHALYVTCY
jgi:hypothetical protein